MSRVAAIQWDGDARDCDFHELSSEIKRRAETLSIIHFFAAAQMEERRQYKWQVSLIIRLDEHDYGKHPEYRKQLDRLLAPA